MLPLLALLAWALGAMVVSLTCHLAAGAAAGSWTRCAPAATAARRAAGAAAACRAGRGSPSAPPALPCLNTACTYQLLPLFVCDRLA